MGTILIVEDTPMYQKRYERELAGNTMIITGSSRLARAEFAQMQSELDLIILDGQLEGDPESDTIQMAIDFRAAGYTGPMIAASNNPTIAHQLMEKNRCSHRADSKSDVPALVKQILSV